MIRRFLCWVGLHAIVTRSEPVAWVKGTATIETCRFCPWRQRRLDWYNDRVD